MGGKQEPANASTKLESMAVKKTTPYLLNALSFKSLKLKTKQQELLIRVFILGLVYVLAFIARQSSCGPFGRVRPVPTVSPPKLAMSSGSRLSKEQKGKAVATETSPKKDKKKKPAEKDPVPSVGAENRKLVVHEESSRGAGLVAAALIAIFPGYISRSVDNEAVAIFALLLTFYLFVKAVNTISLGRICVYH
ncbi:unnamed protein product [Brassica oleracea]